MPGTIIQAAATAPKRSIRKNTGTVSSVYRTADCSPPEENAIQTIRPKVRRKGSKRLGRTFGFTVFPKIIGMLPRINPRKKMLVGMVKFASRYSIR